MSNRIITQTLLSAVLALSAATAVVHSEAQTGSQTSARQQYADIYGWQLMTAEERDEYRAKMRAAKTAQEREQIREEHHAQMVERAKERGAKLPDQPPTGGNGVGPGMAPGSGGMGPGGGRR